MHVSDKVQEAVVQWFRQQGREFFANGIQRHVHQWDSCLNACVNFLQQVQNLQL